MANDNHRSLKVKDDDNIKSKQKMITQDTSPASSSRRSSRETPSRKQTKESLIKESPKKENLINTRKSERLEKRTPSDTTPIKEKSEGAHVQRITTPMKRYDRRKKLDVGADAVNTQSKSSGSCREHAPEKAPEVSVSSNMKSKKEKSLKSLKQCVTDTTEDKKNKRQGLDAGGRKRKRVSSGIDKSKSKPQRKRTETGVVNDKEIEERSSEADSSSSRDVDSELEKRVISKSVVVIECSDDDCSDRMGEESTVTASKRQCKASNIKEALNDRFMDTEQDRMTCEATGLAAIVEKNNDVSRMGTIICIVCKLGGKLRDCDTVCCNRCFHLSCLDPPVNEVLSKNSLCPICVKNINPSVPLVPESIWDTREVEVSDTQGLQKQKQYLVKYKGLAHIHNQWITEAQLLFEAPLLLVENSSKNGSTKWSEEWTVPHQLLKKRLILSFKPLYESKKNTTKVLYYYNEWLVQWKGLDSEQATWESENISVLDSPEGHNLVKEYEMHHGNGNMSASSDDKIEEMSVTLPILPAGCPPGMESIHLGYVKNLHDAWNKGQTSIVFDDQERTMRIVLFIFSLKSVTQPFLLITTSDSLSQWQAMFLKMAPCNSFKVSLEDTDEKRSSMLLRVQKEGGDLGFQVLLYPVDAYVKDLNVLKAIKWEAVIVDESQSSEISSHFSHTKSLSTDKRLLVFCGPLGVSMTSYFDVLSLLDCDVISKTELDDLSKLKEALSKLIAYECKPNTSKFAEYWVPVQISKVQLEQYCSTLLSNAMALSSCSKSDTTGALHDILVSNRKCCDHPYIVDQSLQAVLTKDLEPVKYLDVGIKASGKLQFLDLILPEMRKRQLRVLILFQPLSGSGKDSASIGDILDDFVRQRFGENSYERVDGIGIIPSKKQAALNNFNNKDMGRFIFLLEYRACLSSIKLSSVDAIIIFDSDWNPANDIRALQRIAVDSQSEQIMVFRLYTSSTLEEKILRFAEHNVTIDSKLQNLSRSTSDALLMWGATYLFNKLDEFHSSSVVNNSSEECLWDELMKEFLNLLSHKRKDKDAAKLLITMVQPICGSYGKNISLPSEPDGEQPHSFWRKLLVGKNPGWKYLSGLTPRQRKRERPQYFEDTGRKRKKNANNVIETVASKPVIEGGENGGPTRAPSHVVPQSFPGDAISNEMSFKDLLKLKISKLCEVLRLSEDVKIMVEKFLEYVIENYRVDKEPTSTVHAFLISLCWIGSALLKHKLDREQSITLAKEHLNFSCKEEEAYEVYSKLEAAKERFLCDTDDQKKMNVSKDTILQEVKVEILDSPDNHYNDVVDCTQKDSEGGTINHDQNDSIAPSAGVLNEKVPTVQPSVSPASGQAVPTDLVTQKECIQDNEVQGNPSSLPEINNLQRIDSDGEQCLPSLANPPIAENQSYSPLGEQEPDLHSADRVDCQPHDPSQNPEASAQVLESSVQVPNQAVTLTSHGSNLLHGPRSGNRTQRASQKSSTDPLQAEFERLSELKETVLKCHEAIKMKLKSDYEKELAEVIAQINVRYEAKQQDAEAAFQSKKKEIDVSVNRVVMNKVLAETFRSKCQDLTPFNPAEIQVIQSGGIQHLPQQSSQGRSGGVTSCSQPPSSGIQQVTELQPPLQIVNQTSKLFSATSSRPPSNISSSSTPTRLLPSTAVPASTPTRPPPSTAVHTSTPTRPPPSTSVQPSTRPSTAVPTSTPTRSPSTSVSPSIRPPYTVVPTSTPNRPPSTPVSPIRPPSTAVPASTLSRPTPNVSTITPSSRPLPNINPSVRNLRVPSQIRAPAPHIRPFRPSTSLPPRELASRNVMPSQHSSMSLSMSQTSAQPSPLQTPPPIPANHNRHPTQNSARSMAASSSQPPAPVPVAPAAAASFQLPSLYHQWVPAGSLPATSSSSQPQLSLPPMPSIPISHTGLYEQTPDILRRSALDLLMDMDKQGGLHNPNTLTSLPECLDLTDFGKEGGGSDLVCLSDDD